MAATTIACSGVIAKSSIVVAGKPRNVLKAAPCAQREWAQKTVSNGIKTRQMLVWQPFNNKCVGLGRGPCRRQWAGLSCMVDRETVCGLFAGALAC